jgi:hypothetical protein
MRYYTEKTIVWLSHVGACIRGGRLFQKGRSWQLWPINEGKKVRGLYIRDVAQTQCEAPNLINPV